MKFVQPTKLFLAVLALAAGFATAARADSGNPGDFLHTRTYFGIVGTSVSVNNTGDFDGLNYSRINNPFYEIDLIPAISQNFGYGVFIGHREEAWAVELSFWQSNHNATFGPGVVSSLTGASVTFTQKYQDTAVYDSVNIDFKRYFLTDQQFQPFLDLGVSFPWLVVNNAAENALGQVGPLTLAGLGLDLGAGVEFYFSPNFSIFAGAYQRWASFDEFKGFSTDFNQLTQFGTNTTDEGSGVNFAVGTSVGFE